MRTTSILLILFLSGSAKVAVAELPAPPETHDFTVTILGGKFGVAELDTSEALDEAAIEVTTVLYYGPFGQRAVPFTAVQALTGFCLILGLVIATLTASVMRWKRVRVRQGFQSNTIQR